MSDDLKEKYELYTYLEDLPGLITDIAPDSIVSRTFYKDKQVNVSMFGFDTGQSLSEHTATQPAIIQILSGEGTLTLGNEVKEVGAGAWVRMPQGLKHSLAAKTPLKMLLILLKSG